jgi:hypothetical protein
MPTHSERFDRVAQIFDMTCDYEVAAGYIAAANRSSRHEMREIAGCGVWFRDCFSETKPGGWALDRASLPRPFE